MVLLRVRVDRRARDTQVLCDYFEGAAHFHATGLLELTDQEPAFLRFERAGCRRVARGKPVDTGPDRLGSGRIE